MKSRNLILIVVLVFVLILGGCGCGGYNKMVSLDEDVRNKWGNVQNEYQRRSDLIPNLVSTVKGAANFEQETLTKVIEARAKATQVTVDPDKITPENMERYQQAQGQLSTALGRLLVVSEQYPTLQATQAFRDLQTQIEGTENRIKVSRTDFNNSVQQYNTTVRRFPNNLFAGMFGFTAKPPFQADPGSQNAPKVDFSK
jgi:LemA protein